MTTARFDVTAIGNAIVDVLAQAEDALLDQLKLTKGAMELIDPPTADRLYAAMGPGSKLGRPGREHGAGSPRWAARRPTSARSPTTSWATCSSTTFAPSA